MVALANCSNPGRVQDAICQKFPPHSAFTSAVKSGPYHVQQLHVALFREPRSHVLSQYLECRYDTWGEEVTERYDTELRAQNKDLAQGGEMFPRSHKEDFYKDFDLWVDHFYRLKEDGTHGPKGDFGCYNPWNMQVRQMSCSMLTIRGTNGGGGMAGPHHINPDPSRISLKDANASTSLLSVAMITEMYAESFCVLLFNIGNPGFPKWCSIEVQSSGTDECIKIPYEHHSSHGVPRHSHNDVLAETTAKVDAVTRDDVLLYISAAFKCMRAIAQIESKTGKKVLCESKKHAMLQIFSQRNFPEWAAADAARHWGIGAAEINSINTKQTMSPIHSDTHRRAVYTSLSDYIGQMDHLYSEPSLFYPVKGQPRPVRPEDTAFVWGSVALRLYTKTRLVACYEHLPRYYSYLTREKVRGFNRLTAVTIEPVWRNDGDCAAEDQCVMETTSQDGTPPVAAKNIRSCDPQVCYRMRRANKSIAVPYPTMFRATGQASIDAHLRWMQGLNQGGREYVFSYVGGVHGEHPYLRLQLHKECAASSACKHLPCVGTDLAREYGWNALDQKTCKTDHRAIQLALQVSDFCLQPDGDSPSRQGIFDSILSGCIPVFFSTCIYPDLFIENVYHLFLPAFSRTAYGAGDWSVMLNASAIYGGANVGEMLRAIPQSEVQRMKARLIELAPRIQYPVGDEFETIYTTANARSILKARLGAIEK